MSSQPVKCAIVPQMPPGIRTGAEGLVSGELKGAANQAKSAGEPRGEYLGVTDKTLAMWKCKGRYGLPCVKLGRFVRYKRADLDEFVEKFRRVPPTKRRR